MRILLEIAVITIAACKSGPTPARTTATAAPLPAAAPAAPLCPSAGVAPVFLPAFAASHDLTLDVDRPKGVDPADWEGKMRVDGVLTDAMWPRYAPQVYRLPDGRSVLDDQYAEGLISVWDPARRKLTELANGTLAPISGRGRLIVVPDIDVPVYADIDPAGPRLRELWRANDRIHTMVVGAVDGLPAVLTIPRDQEFRGARGEIVCLSTAGVAARVPITVPAGYMPQTVDPIDGHRMLLIGPYVGIGPDDYGRADKPFHADIAILDLHTGAHRTVGTVDGAYTIATAIPHPYINVEWQGGGSHHRTGELQASYFVDPSTEQLAPTMSLGAP
jgi:hypothetical protein